MNSKRQTIWLVSMLSIMVVLSAYYLFTNESPEDLAGMPADDQHDYVIDHQEIDVDQYDLHDGVVYLDDEYALDEMLNAVHGQQQSSSQLFHSLHLERDENYKEELKRLMAVTATGNVDVIAEAEEQIYAISDKWSKLSHLEDLIRRDFPDAIITESDHMWKVLVNANQMQKSEAVSILNMVMKELGAAPNEVIVELKP